jgi:hypothetical protein
MHTECTKTNSETGEFQADTCRQMGMMMTLSLFPQTDYLQSSQRSQTSEQAGTGTVRVRVDAGCIQLHSGIVEISRCPLDKHGEVAFKQQQ